jgi:aryl-alcohol dehydrogenase-like predicted oxidoreductase
MRKRPLGDTGLSVSELALGTWGLSGDAYSTVSDTDQDRVIDRARALGITLFETADSYAHGAMEKRLGQRLGDDQAAQFATKVGTDREAMPPRKRFDAAFVRDAVARSSERLRRNVVDVVLLHNPSPGAVERGEATGALRELLESGRIGAWGVSAGSLEVARAALAQGAKVLELAHNAFHCRDVRELSAEIEQRGAGVLARSVLAHGLLCGQWPRDKNFAARDHRSERWTTDELRRRLRQLDALRPLVGGDVVSLRAGALRFVLSSASVSCAVLGPRTTLQLDVLVREAGRGPPYLSEESLIALRARLESVGIEV